ncbi:hypothetical protein IJ380_02600 [Candidatus Saccharibacteria bacterium]|nr:hypothetical protein [Candidatus Saccharibacteria bacterium]
MYGYTDQQPETSQKKKIIIVSLIMGIIIIVLIGVLINAIVKKNHLATETGSRVDDSAYIRDENGELVPVEDSSKDSHEVETANAEDGKAEPVANDETVTPSSEEKTVASATEIPATGAEGILGLALLLGSVTAFILSKNLALAKV